MQTSAKRREKTINNILSLSGDKVKTILMTVLEEMRSEQVMLNMLETSDNIREYQDDIDSSINELEDTDFQSLLCKYQLEKTTQQQ